MSAVAAPAPAFEQGTKWRAFWAVLYRDLYVTSREFHVFLAQVILQPLFLLFVFGKVLSSIGATTPGYTDILFPGLLALTAVITALQALAFPLVAEFGWTKEIEDRLLAPMPTSFVVGEKVLFAVVRSLIATTIMIPVGILILGSIPWRWAGFPLFLAGLLLGALVGAGFGLLMGTLVRPERITLLFSLVFTPLLFTGCSQYPWPLLRERADARRDGASGAAHPALDLHRRARLRRRRSDGRRLEGLLPPRDRLRTKEGGSAALSPLSTGEELADVKPEVVVVGALADHHDHVVPVGDHE
jgi:ABC-2 type transport system permease protein